MQTLQSKNPFGKLPAVGLESAHEPTENPPSKAKSIADTNTSNHHQSEIKFKSHFEESDNESEISETSIYSETENEPNWLLPILYIIEILYPLFMFLVFKPVELLKHCKDKLEIEKEKLEQATYIQHQNSITYVTIPRSVKVNSTVFKSHNFDPP